MNCDAKQGCFFKKSVCNSGCKSKLPVEIAKVSTARLTFSSPLARLSEAFPHFLFFFYFCWGCSCFSWSNRWGSFFDRKNSAEIFKYFHDISYKLEPSIFVPSHRTRVQPYDEILAFNRSFNQPAWLTTALRCNHNWLKYLKVVDISSYRCKIVW